MTEAQEILREKFFRDFIETATKEEIIEKLVQNDNRAKELQMALQIMQVDLSEDFYDMKLKDFEKYLMEKIEENYIDKED